MLLVCFLVLAAFVCIEGRALPTVNNLATCAEPRSLDIIKALDRTLVFWVCVCVCLVHVFWCGRRVYVLRA